MFNKTPRTDTTIDAGQSYTGETIEQKIRRIMDNKEPITDGAPLIYTERKHGVLPDYNIRTDRWDVAIDAMDIVNKTEIAKRQARIEAQKATDTINKENTASGEPKTTQGTESTS